MKLKKINKVFNYTLWGCFVVLIGISWILTTQVSAPEFEVVQSDIVFPYEYTTVSGDRVESNYELAWKHEQFSAPKVVAYDSTNGKWVTIKDEYVEEYYQMMPKTNYSFWQRWFWIIFFMFAAVSAVIIYSLGGRLRDTILFLIVKRRNTFSGYAYFLYDDRMVFTKQCKELLVKTIDSYILNKRKYLLSKYDQSFVDLVIGLLEKIKVQKSTRICFYYTYLDQTKQHEEYLKALSLYWESQIGKNESAVKIKNRIDALRQKDYVPLKLTKTASDFQDIVSMQLKNLFSEVMGEEVFNFNVYESSSALLDKTHGVIFLKTIILNNTDYFTWTGYGYSGRVFPGLLIQFVIYNYDRDGNEHIFHDKYLEPKSTYNAEANDLDVSAVYDNMVTETIRSFSESLKK